MDVEIPLLSGWGEIKNLTNFEQSSGLKFTSSPTTKLNVSAKYCGQDAAIMLLVTARCGAVSAAVWRTAIRSGGATDTRYHAKDWHAAFVLVLVTLLGTLLKSSPRPVQTAWQTAKSVNETSSTQG